MKKFIRPTALLMCFSMLLSSCALKGDSDAASERQPVSVRVEKAKNESIEKKNDFMGRVMPDSTVFIIPKVPGEVTRINVNVGDKVKKGQVLFEIDSTIDRLQLEQAAAALDMAKAGLEQATGATYEQQLLQLEGQVSMAQSQKKWTNKTYDDYDDMYDANGKLLLSQKKMAQKGVEKAKEFLSGAQNGLVDKDGKPFSDENPFTEDKKNEAIVASKLSLEAAQRALNEAEAAYENYFTGYEAQYNQLTQGLEQVEIGLDVAEKAYDLAKGEAHEEQIKTIEAQLRQAESAYKLAMQKLSYSSVTSPIDGVVEKKSIDVHGFASQNEPAFIITDKSSVNVTFGVSGEDAANMNVGDTLTVYDKGREYPATIVEVSSFIDMQSGLYTIKANVLNEEGLIMSGSSVKLTATTNKSQGAVTIPTDALYNEKDESYVYVEEGGVVKKTPVKTGIITEKRVEITKGLSGGENVITTWNPGLIDGAPVTVREGE